MKFLFAMTEKSNKNDNEKSGLGKDCFKSVFLKGKKIDKIFEFFPSFLCDVLMWKMRDCWEVTFYRFIDEVKKEERYQRFFIDACGGVHKCCHGSFRVFDFLFFRCINKHIFLLKLLLISYFFSDNHNHYPFLLLQWKLYKTLHKLSNSLYRRNFVPLGHPVIWTTNYFSSTTYSSTTT